MGRAGQCVDVDTFLLEMMAVRGLGRAEGCRRGQGGF